jgi:hypothetical protein
MTEADIAHFRIYVPKAANPVPPVKDPGMADVNDTTPEETTAPAPTDDAAEFTSLGLDIANYTMVD